jgi:hypothetical protein
MNDWYNYISHNNTRTDDEILWCKAISLLEEIVRLEKQIKRIKATKAGDETIRTGA